MGRQMDIQGLWKNNVFLKYIFIGLLIFGCTAKPKQPPLSAKETEYFSQLSKQCNCIVSREFDPRKPFQRPNLEEKTNYTISFDSISVSKINNYDSLEKVSYSIATKLHKEILGLEFDYSYDEIVIFYSARIDAINYKIESFTYKTDSLR